MRRHAAKALMFKAVTLNDADQTAAEMECYEEVLRRYAEDADPGVRAVAADALIHKGMSLATLAEDAAGDVANREIDAEIACYDEVVTRYGEDDSIDLMRAVAEALLHKAEALLEAGQTGAGVACLEAVIDGYGSIKDGELREIVKDARAFKAEIIGPAGCHPTATELTRKCRGLEPGGVIGRADFGPRWHRSIRQETASCPAARRCGWRGQPL